jgi:hypothetical protein
MKRQLCLAIAGLSVLSTAALPQESAVGRPPVSSGEIQIPSQRTLERDAVTIPRNDFSTNDATATIQMERREKRIDSEVQKGICDGC